MIEVFVWMFYLVTLYVLALIEVYRKKFVWVGVATGGLVVSSYEFGCAVVRILDKAS